MKKKFLDNEKILKLQRFLNIFPYFKISKNKGDRLWWIDDQLGHRLYIFCGITKAIEKEQPDAVIYKMYIGPLSFGFGRRIK